MAGALMTISIICVIIMQIFCAAYFVAGYIGAKYENKQLRKKNRQLKAKNRAYEERRAA